MYSSTLSRNSALGGGGGVSASRPGRLQPGKDPVHIVQEVGWAPGSVWMGGNSPSHRDSIPDRPARSSVAIPTELPVPHITKYKILKFCTYLILV